MFSPAPPRGEPGKPLRPTGLRGLPCSPLPVRPPGGSLPLHSCLLVACSLLASPPPHPGARAVALPPCGRGAAARTPCPCVPPKGGLPNTGDEFPRTPLALLPPRIKNSSRQQRFQLLRGVPRPPHRCDNSLNVSVLR